MARSEAATLSPLERNASRVFRVLKNARQLTDAEIATRLGVSRPWVVQKRLGDYRLSVSDIEALSKAMGVPPEIFFTDADEVAETLGSPSTYRTGVIPLRVVASSYADAA